MGLSVNAAGLIGGVYEYRLELLFPHRSIGQSLRTSNRLVGSESKAMFLIVFCAIEIDSDSKSLLGLCVRRVTAMVIDERAGLITGYSKACSNPNGRLMTSTCILCLCSEGCVRGYFVTALLCLPGVTSIN